VAGLRTKSLSSLECLNENAVSIRAKPELPVLSYATKF
jgi:hypothetical protein